jgi:hypothetical protein
MIGDKIAILICDPRLGMTVFAEKWAYGMLRTSELQGHPAGVPPERVFVQARSVRSASSNYGWKRTFSTPWPE